MLGGGGSRLAAGVPGRLCGGPGGSGSLACGCGFGLGRGFVDEVGGGGGRRMSWRTLMRMRRRRKWWLFFGGCGLHCHAGGCGFVGRGGLRCGHCGEDGGHVFGLRVGGGWQEGPGRALAAWRADPVGSGGRGRRGADISAFRASLGSAPAMREGVWFGVRGGEQFAWAALGGGGWGLGFYGCVRGACAGLWAGRGCHGAWGSSQRVCVGCLV